MRLELAYLDAVKVHDVLDPAMPYALSLCRRTVEPRRVVRERSNRHGGRDQSRWYGGQTIDLAGYVRHPDGQGATEDAHDELRALFLLPSEHVFRFRRMGRVAEEQLTFRQAAAFDSPAQGYEPIVKWACTIYAGDPRLYGAALKTAGYDPSAALGGSGVTVPLAMPLVFTVGAGGTAVLEVINEGQFPTPPILTISGPIVDPSVTLLETGEAIVLVGSFGVSDEIVVDVATRSVVLNGAARLDLLDASLSSWFELAAGTSRLRLSGAGMSLGATRLDVSYRDASI